jgi:molybdate transport system ATP-binding protein
MIEITLHKELSAPSGPMHLEIDEKIEQGNIFSFYGPSGAGKTSILRMIAGLLAPSRGRIAVNGTAWYDSDQKINLPPQKRRIGYVFQEYALFPHLTARQNLIFAAGKKGDRQVLDEIVEMIELTNLLDRRPAELSGGQQQRVALARALVRKPQILLLDEALSALDEQMRSKLQDYILKVHRKFGLTTIIVSHNLGEIFKMAERIAILDMGRVTRRGSPNEVFARGRFSGKFRFSGTVLEKRRSDTVFIISVLVGNNVIKVIATTSEAESMEAGDQVLVISKAFNPLIMKI